MEKETIKKVVSYLVPSTKYDDVKYLVVTNHKGAIECSCPDFQNKGDGFRCEHIIACIEANKEGKIEMDDKKRFFEITEKINTSLSNKGKTAIESYEKNLTGYKLQFVIDSVNVILGAENWKYNLKEHHNIKQQITKDEEVNETICLIELFIKVNNEWISKGPMFGSSNLEGANGLKAAIGDAVKKSFAYWGIGNKAYRGEL